MRVNLILQYVPNLPHACTWQGMPERQDQLDLFFLGIPITYQNRSNSR